MKIAYVTTDYNWNSFSSLRCGYETLKNMNLEVDIFFKKEKKIFEYDQIWLMSTGYFLTDEEFLNCKSKVISFGLSEPCNIAIEKRKNCHVYCTNNLEISRKLICYWFPTSADIRYHKNLNLKKDIDVIFIGMGEGHPAKNRLQVVDAIRKNGIKIQVYGNGWPKHQDNFPRIEGEELIRKINQAKTMLDITSKDISLARRIFEGLSCGTSVLTCNREDVIKMFVPNEEIFLYNTVEEIPNKIKYILENRNLLDNIAKNGQKKCVEKHDVSIRIKELLEYIQKG